uniref:Uncharacterized protein n=1 Tax=Cardioderma bat coronavirus TaxID=3119326 RepID=A0AB38ZDJ2_9NIDO
MHNQLNMDLFAMSCIVLFAGICWDYVWLLVQLAISQNFAYTLSLIDPTIGFSVFAIFFLCFLLIPLSMGFYMELWFSVLDMLDWFIGRLVWYDLMRTLTFG